MSTEERQCPNCRALLPADGPEGICPHCALRAGFATEGETPLGPAGPQRSTPRLEDLERLLPELAEFELIGQGGMGTVYRARHRGLERRVAVKVLFTDLSQTTRSSTSFGERFAREARTLARLDHPNIVRVYDFGHREGLYYLIMELVDGVTLPPGPHG